MKRIFITLAASLLAPRAALFIFHPSTIISEL